MSPHWVLCRNLEAAGQHTQLESNTANSCCHENFFFFIYISLCSLMCCLQHRLHLPDHKIQHVARHKPLQVMGFRAPRCLSHVVADGAPSHSALSNNYSQSFDLLCPLSLGLTPDAAWGLDAACRCGSHPRLSC